MRIIAGAKGGLLLKFPKSALVRPATEKVRGAIFNILGDTENHILLDLFAGSGSLGFEGLSRGAGQCVFVDTLDQSIKILKTNAQKLDFLPQCLIIKGLIPSVLRQIKKQINQFDEVFIDPPYDRNLINVSLAGLASNNLVDAGSTIIIEHSPREVPSYQGFKTVDQRKYGQTLVSFLKKIERV